jgi:hypothetical protein
MQMPSVGPELQRLSELLSGTWRGEETLFPSEWDPVGGPAFGTWIVHPSLDGFAILVDYIEERDGKVVYRGHGVHGWDAAAGCFLVYWFDNIGVMPRQATRARLDGNRYTYESNDGPRGWTRMTYSWDDGRFEFRIDKSADAKTWKPMHDGRYTRAGR